MGRFMLLLGSDSTRMVVEMDSVRPGVLDATEAESTEPCPPQSSAWDILGDGTGV